MYLIFSISIWRTQATLPRKYLVWQPVYATFYVDSRLYIGSGKKKTMHYMQVNFELKNEIKKKVKVSGYYIYRIAIANDCPDGPSG